MRNAKWRMGSGAWGPRTVHSSRDSGQAPRRARLLSRRRSRLSLIFQLPGVGPSLPAYLPPHLIPRSRPIPQITPCPLAPSALPRAPAAPSSMDTGMIQVFDALEDAEQDYDERRERVGAACGCAQAPLHSGSARCTTAPPATQPCDGCVSWRKVNAVPSTLAVSNRCFTCLINAGGA